MFFLDLLDSIRPCGPDRPVSPLGAADALARPQPRALPDCLLGPTANQAQLMSGGSTLRWRSGYAFGQTVRLAYVILSLRNPTCETSAR